MIDYNNLAGISRIDVYKPAQIMVILIRASTYIVKNDICGGYFCMGDIGQIIKILPPYSQSKSALDNLSIQASTPDKFTVLSSHPRYSNNGYCYR